MVCSRITFIIFIVYKVYLTNFFFVCYSFYVFIIHITVISYKILITQKGISYERLETQS